MNNKKTKGFTLVELLVVVVIIGIIAIIAIPSVNSIKSKNEQKKYQKYQESISVAGELFTDSFHEDMFGITGDGCYDVDYDELNKRNLVKDYKTSGITCRTPETFVHITRKNGKYKYETSIKCIDTNGKVIYEDLKQKCEPPVPEDLGYPIITVTPKHLNSWGLNWSTKKEITIDVKSGLGLNSNVIISYGFSKTKGEIPSNMLEHRYVNKYKEHTVSYKFIDDSNPDGTKKNGQYYLYVEGKDTLDIGAHHAESIWVGPLNYDNQAPTTPVLTNPRDNIWTGKEYVDAKKYVIDVKSSDNTSGVAYYQYRYPNSNTSSERIWASYDKLSGNNIKTTPFIKERNHKVEIRACDYGNNCSAPGSSIIKIDKTLPTVGKVTNSSESKWVNRNVEVTATATDDKISTGQAGSGVDRIVYSYGDSEYNDWNKDTVTYVSGIWGAERDNKIYIIAYDKAGNKSKIKYSGKIRIDKTAPQIDEYSNSGQNKWTNNSINVYAHAIDPNIASNQKGSGIYQIYYSYDKVNRYKDWNKGYETGSTAKKTFPTDIDKDIYIIVKDNAGNEMVFNGGHLYVDKTPPKISDIYNSSKSFWTNKDVIISANINDSNGSGINHVEYNYGGGKIGNLALSNGKVRDVWSAERNNSINIVAYDNVGNKTTVSAGQIKIDKTNPSVTDVYNSSKSQWTNKNVTISANVADGNGSGISSVEYNYGGSSVGYLDWPNGRVNDVWSAERNNNINLVVHDNAGNVTSVSAGSIKIDKTVPTITSIYNSSNSNWTNKNVTISADVNDSNGSGINHVEYNYGGSKIEDLYYSGGKTSGTWSAERNNNINLVAYDNAGNRASVSAGSIKIDKTNPTITSVYNSSNSNWTNKNVTISANVNDSNGSGINHVEYNYGGSKIEDLYYSGGKTSGTWSAERNNNINLVAYDNVGNVTSVPAGSIKIDKTAPSLTNSLKSKSCDYMKIAFNATDSGSGVSYYEYKFDDGAWTNWNQTDNQWKNKDKTIYFRAADAIGNVSGPTDGIKIEFADCDPKENGGGGNLYCTQLRCDGSRVYQKCYDENGYVFDWYNGNVCSHVNGENNKDKGGCKGCKELERRGSKCYQECEYLNGRGICYPAEKEVPCPKPKPSPSPSPKPKPKPSCGSCSICRGAPGSQFKFCPIGPSCTSTQMPC